MVSALWKACSENDLEKVLELLPGAAPVDLEIKDHTGATPLIVAVQNGHVEVVKALLDRGADPHNASSQGRPEQYTTDPAILHLLGAAQAKISADAPVAPPPEHVYDPSKADPNMQQQHQQFWAGPPPPMYAYYPGMPPPHPGAENGMAYYPPPPPPPPQHSGEASPGSPGNLPPPDVARMIPCRYFPACRYGASCMFAHPQGPYWSAPPAPAPYSPPYDGMAPQPFPSSYYPVPPPSFQPSPSNGVPPPHMDLSASPSGPMPPPPMVHGRSGSEVMPSPQAAFAPPSAPPMPYGAPSMSPTYSHPGAMSMPVSVPPPAPIHHHPSSAGPQSPQVMYPNAPSQQMPPPAPTPFLVHPPPQPGVPNGEPNGAPKPVPVHPQQDAYANGHLPPRDGMGHHRRGSGVRRPSFAGSRKPPCMFFPSGRCRNGDECRFPHVMPDGPGGHPHNPHYGGRGGHRPRFQSTPNAFGAIEEKFASMTVRDPVQDAPVNGSRSQNGTEPSSRSDSSDAGNRQRPQHNGHNGFRNGNGANGFGGARAEHNKRAPPPPAMKQRLPSADEFPVLTGSTPSPCRSPGANGPTAAQVLQAPPPAKKESTAPVPAVNGHADAAAEKATPPPAAPQPLKAAETNGAVHNGYTSPVSIPKLPVSFAAAANGAVGSAPDTPKEVSVSA